MNIKRLFFSIFLIFSLLATPVLAIEQQHVVTFGQNLNFSKDRLDEAVSKIGSTAKASIVLRYGTWNLDANQTILSNINFQIPPGAVLDGAYTLTIQGGFNGSVGCFGSSLTVVFATGSVDEVLPKWFNEDSTSLTRTRASIAVSGIPMFLGKITTDPTTTGWGSPEAGTRWYNSTTQTWKFWNGTAISNFESFGTMADESSSFVGIHASNYATIELADAAAYAAGKLLVVSQNYTLTANTTLTASVMRIPGGSFTKASTYTLTFSGSFENPSNGHCFIGFDPGDVTFGIDSLVKVVHPEWWGVDGINDEIPINSAANSLPLNLNTGLWWPHPPGREWAGTVQLTGKYTITAPITLPDSINLVGRGRETSHIYNANVSGLNAIEITATRAAQLDYHTTLRNFMLSGNASSGHGVYISDSMYPDLSNLFIWGHGGCGIKVKAKGATYGGVQVGGWFDNLYIFANGSWGILWSDPATDTVAGTAFRITRCHITANGSLDGAGGVKIWLSLQGGMNDNIIEGNAGVGLQISGVAGTYTNNYFEFNDGGNKAITNITKANPAVVTYTASGYNYKNGQTVSIFSVEGMTEVNNLAFTIANVNTTTHTFELSGIDSSAYTDYTSGGEISGVNVLLTTEGIGQCNGNLLSGTYLAYGSMHLKNTAINNVIFGTYFTNGSDNPNLIVDASSSSNQVIGTRSSIPIRLGGSGAYVWQNDHTKMMTLEVEVINKIAIPHIFPLVDDTYVIGNDPTITGVGSITGFKSLVLHDTTDGKHYKITVINGVVTATALD